MSHTVPDRCHVCMGLVHRFSFGADGTGNDGCAHDGASHKPTAVACANGVIASIERLLNEKDDQIARYMQEGIEGTITRMAFTIDRLMRHDEGAEHG